MLRRPQLLFRKLHPALRWLVFVVITFLGVLFLQAFIFRVYNVFGPSMEPALYTGDRLVVNKLPRTMGGISGTAFIPKRGEIVVFKNPLYQPGQPDEYIVKRVIGVPGDRVVVRDGTITIYNQANPQGFNPDNDFRGAQQPTNGNVDRLVPEGEIFVAGDNRIASHSLDSRNGLSTIPAREIEGTILFRIFPFNTIKFF